MRDGELGEYDGEGMRHGHADEDLDWIRPPGGDVESFVGEIGVTVGGDECMMTIFSNTSRLGMEGGDGRLPEKEIKERIL